MKEIPVEIVASIKKISKFCNSFVYCDDCPFAKYTENFNHLSCFFESVNSCDWANYIKKTYCATWE